jgi:alpha-tubulin suppressor-like RCC1 family protein
MKLKVPGSGEDAPTISLVSDQSTLVDTPITSLAFIISDEESSLSCTSSVSVTTSDPSVIALSGIVISGTAPNCLADLTPVASATGVSTITLTVTDGAQSTSTSFDFQVTNGGTAPVASNISPAAFDEDTQSILTLSYTDADLDQATTCSLSSLTNITITQACACAAGTCTVGVTGTSNYNGAASFSYTVTAAGQVSNSASATLSISPLNDAPVASNLIPTAFNEDTQSIITLVYNDVEGNLATVCSLTALTNVTVTQACACSLGTCTVGVTGTANYNGAASFNYTVTAGGQASNSASSTLSITAVNDAPVISAITNQDVYVDAAITVGFTITDVDNTLNCSSSVTPSYNNNNFTPVVLAGTAPNCDVTIQSKPRVMTGDTNITLTVSDGTLSSFITFNADINFKRAKLKSIFSGYHTYCAVDGGNRVFCWGDNSYNIIDTTANLTYDRPIPTDIQDQFSASVINIGMGDGNLCALYSTGQIGCRGRNDFGQLGDNSLTDSASFTAFDQSNLQSDESFTQIDVSKRGAHACGVTTAGRIYCWGSRVLGQTGDGQTTMTPQPQATEVSNSFFNSGEYFTQVSTGTAHTCSLSNQGRIFCWGSNLSGELGVGIVFTGSSVPLSLEIGSLNNKDKRFVKVYAGNYMSCAISGAGNTFCWGSDANGMLGDGGSDTDTKEPILAVQGASFHQNEVFKSLSLGNGHVCGITASGRGFCWGEGSGGRLGDGNNSQSSLPVLLNTDFFQDVSSGTDRPKEIASAEASSCFLSSRGDVFCWGEEGHDELGNGSEESADIPDWVNTSSIDTYERFTTLALGKSSACSISSLGRSLCWGDNSTGQTGISSVTGYPEVIGSLSGDDNFIQIAVGPSHACGIKSDGKAYCWGDNSTGQRGSSLSIYPDYEPFIVDSGNMLNDERFVSLSIGFDFSCGLTALGNLYCWGSNSTGQVGDGVGGGGAILIPTRVSEANLANDEAFLSVSTGDSHACALTTRGNSFCWGSNWQGGIGDGTNATRVEPYPVDFSLGPTSGFTQILAGGYTSCGLSKGEVFCWGLGTSGQIGDGGNASTGRPVNRVQGFNSILASKISMNNIMSVCALVPDRNNNLYCWGDNTFYPIDNTNHPSFSQATQRDLSSVDNSHFVNFQIGNTFACGTTIGGYINCWGDGANNQQGIPSSGTQTDPSNSRPVEEINLN